MQQFATLLDTLSTTQSRLAKLALLAEYFKSAPDPDRGHALAALTDGLAVRVPLRRILTDIMADKLDPVLLKLSRDYVGDTAETVSLLWPDVSGHLPPPALGDAVKELQLTRGAALGTLIASTLDRLDVRQRWAYLKLIGGAPRVGVSARLAKTALAQAFNHTIEDIEEVWHAVEQPYGALFDWLEGRAEKPLVAGMAVFRPLMLAHPIEDSDWTGLAPDMIAAEWKWDGIRVQIAAGNGIARLFSRTGDEISNAFPEIVSAFAHLDAVADGELLVVRNGSVAPFNDLQQRLNRKAVTAKQMREYPAHVRLYDLLFENSEDLRILSFRERRARLEAWHNAARPSLSDVSALVPFPGFDALRDIWASTRDASIEGLMLKKWDSPYLAGRLKGHWYKWKRASLTLDCVLMYAQRGSGKRSSFYSDYTFGVWREELSGARTLVPVGKAYSGFTDQELKQLDRFIRDHTIETFGPVRSVEPRLVFEVAFDAVQPSSRHKSGVAMRFPRIHRIRWDKPAVEADTLEAVKALIPS